MSSWDKNLPYEILTLSHLGFKYCSVKCHKFLGSTRRVCQGFAKTCKCSYIWSVWCSMSRMGHRRLSKIPRSTLQGKLLNTGILLPKLFWPTVGKFCACHQFISLRGKWVFGPPYCSSHLKNFANSRPSVSNFKSLSRSLEQFFLTVTKYHWRRGGMALCYHLFL